MGTLTVRENLAFSANLRLSGKTHNEKARKDKVQEVIEQLGLQSCAETMVRLWLRAAQTGAFNCWWSCAFDWLQNFVEFGVKDTDTLLRRCLKCETKDPWRREWWHMAIKPADTNDNHAFDRCDLLDHPEVSADAYGENVFIDIFNDNLAIGGSLTGAIFSCHAELSTVQQHKKITTSVKRKDDYKVPPEAFVGFQEFINSNENSNCNRDRCIRYTKKNRNKSTWPKRS